MSKTFFKLAEVTNMAANTNIPHARGISQDIFKIISLTYLAVKDNLWLLLMLEGKSIKSN